MQLNFAAVLKYSLVTYVDIIRDRCQKTENWTVLQVYCTCEGMNHQQGNVCI